MFEEYKFTVKQKGIDLGETVVVKINPISFILPLASEDIAKGEESYMMADVFLSFIKELKKSYKILKITQ